VLANQWPPAMVVGLIVVCFVAIVLVGWAIYAAIHPTPPRPVVRPVQEPQAPSQ
jgi:hypothetical protein